MISLPFSKISIYKLTWKDVLQIQKHSILELIRHIWYQDNHRFPLIILNRKSRTRIYVETRRLYEIKDLRIQNPGWKIYIFCRTPTVSFR